MNWLSYRPSLFLDDVSISFRGKVVDKYFMKVTHFKVELDSSIIDIGGLDKELREQTEIGDSLIKYPNSNCCRLVKDSSDTTLKYKFIPEKVLQRSEYLTRINEQKCD